MNLTERLERRFGRYLVVLRTAAGIVAQTGILAIGGFVFWALVGHRAGSTVLGEAASASSLATLGAGLAAAGAMHLVIARKQRLRSLVPALAIVCPLIAAAFCMAFASRDRELVAVLAAASALGLVCDAAAVAATRPRRVVVRGAFYAGAILLALIFTRSLVGIIAAMAIAATVAAATQFVHWASKPDITLLKKLGKDIWSNHIAGIAGQAPAYVVAPIATIMTTSVVAGEAYIAMALVGPLTSVSVALTAGVHTDGARSGDDTRRLYLRSLLTVFALSCLGSVLTVFLHAFGPSFAAAAPVVASMTFATVFDASSNIYSAIWRLQRRLVVVPAIYIVELVAFVVGFVVALPHLGLTSVAIGWYAQGLAGTIFVLIIERRLVPARGSTPTSVRTGPSAES